MKTQPPTRYGLPEAPPPPKPPRVDENGVPAGWTRVEAYTDGRRLVVLGEPEEGEAHNCDAMGCGSFSHVVARVEVVLT
jgi:hypothetical protein